MKKLFSNTLLVVFSYFLLELFSWLGLKFVDKHYPQTVNPTYELSEQHSKLINKFVNGESEYFSFDSTLGWSIKKNGQARKYRANSAGIRADKEYPIEAVEGVRRIAAFGDSFTHCDDVENSQTWQSWIERNRQNTEVLNFGVGGYGLDQAYLRYLKEGKQYNPDIVLIGFITDNLRRHVNVYRPFLYPGTQLPLTKPRYKVENGKLSLFPNPMRELGNYKNFLSDPSSVLAQLGENDFFYKKRYSNPPSWSPTARLSDRVYKELERSWGGLPSENLEVGGLINKNSEAHEVTKTLFDEFYQAAVSNNSKAVILLFPDRGTYRNYLRNGTKTYAPLISHFESKGYEYIDLLDALKSTPEHQLFKGHYTSLGNELVAREISKLLLQNLNDPRP